MTSCAWFRITPHLQPGQEFLPVKSSRSSFPIIGTGPCAMYGEAILRVSCRAGWPTLGGVPGQLTFDCYNALDPEKTNHMQKSCRL